MHRTAAIAAVAGCIVLLSGCVPTTEVPSSRPTDEEVESWLAQQDDWLWELTAIDDTLRPSPIEHRSADDTEWIPSLSECMIDRGYARYDIEAASRLTYVFDPADPVEERLDWFECQATYQFDPRPYLMGGAMLDYLYDYNRSYLVPCLEAHGASIEFVPTRADATFGGDFAGWNPYYWMRDTFDPSSEGEDWHVFESCPAFPQASYFDEMRDVW